MQLQSGQVLPYLPDFLRGALLSVQIAFLAFAMGLAIGLLGASVLRFGPRATRLAVHAYVGFFTNTPQLVQVFFLFYALPESEILLTPFQAVLLGMTLNAGAYLTEIQRAGFDSVRREELEAAETLGFNRVQTVWYVIAPHVLRTLYPSLSSQYIIMTLGTSMAAIFGVEELTGQALNANAISFRSIEIFLLTAVIYVGITIIASLLLYLLGRWLFRIRRGSAF
jgi:polar amino acid transport system permease protein